MPQHRLTQHIPLTSGNGVIPCSEEYHAAFEARNALHRPDLDHPTPDDIDRADRRRWFEHNAEMDRLQWLGGHVGATIFYDAPGTIPHGWLVLKKTEHSPDHGPLDDRDGQWHPYLFQPLRYVTQTGDNGEPDLGLLHAVATVRAARQGFAEWATKREKPRTTEFLLLACHPVDEGEAP